MTSCHKDIITIVPSCQYTKIKNHNNIYKRSKYERYKKIEIRKEYDSAAIG